MTAAGRRRADLILSVLAMLCLLTVLTAGCDASSSSSPVADGDSFDSDSLDSDVAADEADDLDTAEADEMVGSDGDCDGADKADAGDTAVEGVSDLDKDQGKDGDVADESPFFACEAAIKPFGVVFAPDPDDSGHQINPAVAFDGGGVWIIYNRPNAANGFAVWGLRLGCDGQPLVEPTPLNVASFDRSCIEPTVAYSDGRVLAVWQCQKDDGAFDIRYSLLDAEDGATLGEADRLLSMGVFNAGTEVSAWMPAASGLHNGGFVIIGSVAHPSYTQWQLFAQRLDRDGNALEDPFLPAPDPDAGQVYGAVAANPDGDLYLAFTRSPAKDPDAVVFTRVAANAAVADPSPAVRVLTEDDTANPAIAVQDGSKPWVAFTLFRANDSLACVLDGSTIAADLPSLRRQEGSNNYSPAVAGYYGGGMMLWMRRTTAVDDGGTTRTTSALLLQAFTKQNGAVVTASRVVTVANAWGAPYPPALTALTDHYAFSAWVNTTYMKVDGVWKVQYRLRAAFTDLSAR